MLFGSKGIKFERPDDPRFISKYQYPTVVQCVMVKADSVVK